MLVLNAELPAGIIAYGDSPRQVSSSARTRRRRRSARRTAATASERKPIAVTPMTGCAPRGSGKSRAGTDPTPARCGSFDVNRIWCAVVAPAARITALMRMLAQTDHRCDRGDGCGHY